MATIEPIRSGRPRLLPVEFQQLLHEDSFAPQFRPLARRLRASARGGPTGPTAAGSGRAAGLGTG
ncbi:hypothetical protein, partial [Halovibrio sp. HP20-50]|uniref:hypothetical protein n=1 Tax=Halovibrio sp. HP20-59 TaxID=3080275 RepID=UPI00294B595E